MSTFQVSCIHTVLSKIHDHHTHTKQLYHHWLLKVTNNFNHRCLAVALNFFLPHFQWKGIQYVCEACLHLGNIWLTVCTIFQEKQQLLRTSDSPVILVNKIWDSAIQEISSTFRSFGYPQWNTSPKGYHDRQTYSEAAVVLYHYFLKFSKRVNITGFSDWILIKTQ